MVVSLRRLTFLLLCCSPFLGGASACEDTAACDEAVRVTRDAISKGQTAAARQWRDHAWKVCSDTTALAPLDQEIVAKETEQKNKVEDAAKQSAAAAKRRMDKAQQVWRQFDDLDADKQTLDKLEPYREKADQMGEGLPPEYKTQIDEYNSKEYSRRKRRIKDREK